MIIKKKMGRNSHRSCCVVNCKNTIAKSDCKFNKFPTAKWKINQKKCGSLQSGSKSRRGYINMDEKGYEAISTNTEGVLRIGAALNNERAKWFGKRHIQMLLLTFCTFLVTSTKAYMSVCIIAMTDPKASVNKNIPTYNWNNTNLILSFFFWGYWIPQIFAGWLTSTRFGPKWMLLGSIGTSSIIGYCIPSVAYSIGSIGVLLSRFFQGIMLGFHGPSIYALFGKWIPESERSRFVGFVTLGSTVGIICSMFLSGQIAASSYGWPMIMYLFSSGGLIWCILFARYGYNSPQDHPTMSQEETMLFPTTESSNTDNRRNMHVPWKQIFSSICFWSLILAQCGQSFGYYVLLTEMSNYLKNILKMDIRYNGFISALPYFLTLVLIIGFGFISDMFIKRNLFTVGTTRKILTAVGFIIPGITFVIIAFCGPEDVILAVILSVIGIGTDLAANTSGILVNYVDLSPNYSGALIGIANQFAQPFSALGPMSVHFIMSDPTSISQWRIVFFLTMGFKALTGTFFLIFGSGEKQSWNELPTRNTNDDREETDSL